MIQQRTISVNGSRLLVLILLLILDNALIRGEEVFHDPVVQFALQFHGAFKERSNQASKLPTDPQENDTAHKGNTTYIFEGKASSQRLITSITVHRGVHMHVTSLIGAKAVLQANIKDIEPNGFYVDAQMHFGTHLHHPHWFRAHTCHPGEWKKQLTQETLGSAAMEVIGPDEGIFRGAHGFVTVIAMINETSQSAVMNTMGIIQLHSQEMNQSSAL